MSLRSFTRCWAVTASMAPSLRLIVLVWALLGACCNRAPELSSQINVELIRADLDSRHPGMSGDEAVIRPETSVDSIEADSLREIRACESCPQVPFGYQHDRWVALRDQVKDGDAIVYFRNSRHAWLSLAGAEGYALVRGDKIIVTIITSVS